MLPAAPGDWSPPAGSSASSLATRNSMLANRGRDTKPELALRSALHRMGLRFRVDARPLPDVPRRADIVFRKAQVAVFVDGCFWHGCATHASWPKKNATWWREKIERNVRRDRDTDRVLAEAGWRAIHVWEHDDPIKSAGRIAVEVRTEGHKID